MTKSSDSIVKILLPIFLAAALGWGTYLTAQADDLKKVDTDQDKKITANEVRNEYIKESLIRIEKKVDKLRR